MKKIALTGSSGLIGSELSVFLESKGYEVIRLRSNQPYPKEYFDVVIHLSGASIFKRWSKKHKKNLFSSRIDSTEKLLSSLPTPKIFLCASAVGYYNGSHGKKMTEKEEWNGSSFLSNLVRHWEMKASKLTKKGARVVNIRFGVVLTSKGGLIAKLLLPFKLGLGTIMGSGNQLMSWISMTDLLHAIDHILSHDEIKGPVNVCAPKPVSNRDFSTRLAFLLKRPLFFRLPSWFLILIFGDMAKETILSSVWAYPDKLLSTGFSFQQENFDKFKLD